MYFVDVCVCEGVCEVQMCIWLRRCTWCIWVRAQAGCRFRLKDRLSSFCTQVSTREAVSRQIAQQACEQSVMEEKLPGDIAKLAIAQAIASESDEGRLAVRTAP